MVHDLPELIVPDAPAWRSWLEEHHQNPAGVWLVLAKKGTMQPTGLRYDDALEEALCQGWIDGQARSRDGATYGQRFTQRRSRSPWSARNVGIVARLVAEDRLAWPRLRAPAPTAVGTPMSTRSRPWRGRSTP